MTSSLKSVSTWEATESCRKLLLKDKLTGFYGIFSQYETAAMTPQSRRPSYPAWLRSLTLMSSLPLSPSESLSTGVPTLPPVTAELHHAAPANSSSPNSIPLPCSPSPPTNLSPPPKHLIHPPTLATMALESLFSSWRGAKQDTDGQDFSSFKWPTPPLLQTFGIRRANCLLQSEPKQKPRWV